MASLGGPPPLVWATAWGADAYRLLTRLLTGLHSAAEPRGGLAMQPARRELPAAQDQGQILCRTGQLLPGPGRPVDVLGPQSNSAQVGAEVLARLRRRDGVQDCPEPVRRDAPADAERHGDVQAVDHVVGERAQVAAARRLPRVRGVVLQDR